MAWTCRRSKTSKTWAEVNLSIDVLHESDLIKQHLGIVATWFNHLAAEPAGGMGGMEDMLKGSCQPPMASALFCPHKMEQALV